MSHNIVNEQFESLRQKLSPEPIHGIEVELSARLPSGWELDKSDDRYVLHGDGDEDWDDHVWRLIRFISYKALFVVRSHASDDGRVYELVSASRSGRAFFIRFQPRAWDD